MGLLLVDRLHELQARQFPIARFRVDEHRARVDVAMRQLTIVVQKDQHALERQLDRHEGSLSVHTYAELLQSPGNLE